MGSSYPARELLPGELFSAGLMAEFDDLKGLSQPYHFCDSSPSQLIWGEYCTEKANIVFTTISSFYGSPHSFHL